MIEVLKQAIEALELVNTEFVCNGAHHAKKDRHELGEPCPIVERYEEAIQAGKQAIAGLESQEFVCEWCDETGMVDSGGTQPWGEAINIPCRCQHTNPPQRTWHGLTDEEIETIYANCSAWDKFEYERMLEAKLKELNT
jgi:hypothetical protein